MTNMSKIKSKNNTKSKTQSNQEDIGNLFFRRSLFYAICIFSLLQFLLIPLQKRSYFIFWILSLAGYSVILLELFYSRITAKPVSLRLKFISQRVWKKHFLQHLLLPSILYFCGVLFIFFNRIRLLEQAAIVIISLSFWLLFYNISMIYMKAYHTSEKTKYIFNFIRIIVFYFITDAIINGVFYYGIERVWIYIGVAVVTVFLINFMIFIFEQLSLRTSIWALITGVLIGGLSLMIMLLNLFSITILSLVITILFYLAVAVWHHKLEGTFNWDIMTQYSLFAVMAIILLLYL